MNHHQGMVLQKSVGPWAIGGRGAQQTKRIGGAHDEQRKKGANGEHDREGIRRKRPLVFARYHHKNAQIGA